jgi:hypothetical protein
MYKLRLIALAIVAVMTLALGGTAYADDLHLCDVSTGCSSSSLIGIPSGTTTVYVTGKSVSNETLWLAILSPSLTIRVILMEAVTPPCGRLST